MNTLIPNFHKFTDSLEGVTKLRKLILHLAVQGKLVEQDPNDESASVLLEKIKGEKEQLVKDCKIKQPRSLPPIDPSEIPYKLPNSWNWVRLDIICSKITDGSHNPPPKQLTGIPMLSGQNVLNNEITLDASRYVTRSDFVLENNRTCIAENDIFLTIVGTIGRSAVVPPNFPKIAIQRSIATISSFIYSYYLCNLFQSPIAHDYFNKYAKGTAQKGIYLNKIRQMIVPIPPLSEQNRIVEKVDSLMKLCDELEEKLKKRNESQVELNKSCLHALTNSKKSKPVNPWKRIKANFALLYNNPENVKELRQTILQLAVHGKLVPQDPKDEPASVLLKKIKTEKEQLIKDGKIKEPKPLPPINPTEIPYELASGWEWVRLGTITSLVTDGEHQTPPRIQQQVVPLGTAKNIREGHLDMSITDFVSTQTAEKCWKRCKPIHDDILMVCVGATTGRLCLVKSPPEFVLVRSVTLIRCMPMIHTEYIEYFLRSPEGQRQVWAGVKQSAQPCLYLNKTVGFAIPLPPLSEQRRVMAQLDRLMPLCDQLEEQLKTSQSKSIDLMDAIVHQVTKESPRSS